MNMVEFLLPIAAVFAGAIVVLYMRRETRSLDEGSSPKHTPAE